MENKIYITKELVRKMYNELSEEIKKDEYNNTYAWFDWSPIILNNNIEKSVYFSQKISSISYVEKIYGIDYGEIVNKTKNGSKYIIVYYEDYDERFIKLDNIKKIMQGILDFEKIKDLEDEDGEISNISLQELLDKNIILDKKKFLKIYFQVNYVCLLKDLDLKNTDIVKLLNLYYELILEDSSYAEIIYLDNIEDDDIVKKHL